MAELIVALDVASRGEAVEKVKAIGDAVGFYKIGLELFAAEGPDVVKAVRDLGKRVFLVLRTIRWLCNVLKMKQKKLRKTYQIQLLQQSVYHSLHKLMVLQ